MTEDATGDATLITRAESWPPPVMSTDVKIAELAVTAERIVAYAQACGETDPRYLDPAVPGGLVAPPTFFYVTGFEPVINGEELVGPPALLAGDHAEFLATVRPGDTLTVWGRLSEAYAKTGRSGTLKFAVWQLSFVNQHGAVVARLKRSMAGSSSIQPPTPA